MTQHEHHDEEPTAADDSPVVMKRWWVAIVLAALIPIGLQKFQRQHERDAEIAVMKEQILAITRVIDMYEGPSGLRVQRAQEITKLQEQVSEIQRSFERQSALQQREQQAINDKLERLLSRR